MYFLSGKSNCQQRSRLSNTLPFIFDTEFVPTVIPLLESRNLDVGQRRSKSFQQNSNNQNAANQFVNQLFNHQQLSSNNVPSILSNSNNAFNSQPYPAIERASSINHHVAINAQVIMYIYIEPLGILNIILENLFSDHLQRINIFDFISGSYKAASSTERKIGTK
jgi:hypothetical protein